MAGRNLYPAYDQQRLAKCHARVEELEDAGRKMVKAFRDYDRASDVGGAGFDLAPLSLAATHLANLLEPEKKGSE